MTRAAAVVAAVAFLLCAAVPAGAADLVRPRSLDEQPKLRERTPREALRIAERTESVRSERASHPGATCDVFLKGSVLWQVSCYAKARKGERRKEIAQVTVGDRSGAVIEEWTGFRVAWTMARGYDGAFGEKVNAPYVWIPLLVMFVVPFVDPRRWRRMLHLDLLVLCGFSVSLAFFNDAEAETSVPLVYPLLAYLIGRMLWVGLRRRDGGEPPRLLVPVWSLAVGLVFLMGFRIGLNIVESNVIDVGYSGVIGADRLADGTPLYGAWPADNEHGDTYGPVAYAAYIPFEQIIPWSGVWDELWTAHAAAIAFDVLTVIGLVLLGRRIGGMRLGVAVAYAWAAFPFTLYVMNTSANDSLVTLLVVATLLVAGSAPARGALAALAGMTKFAPLGLAPLLATHGLAGLGWRRRLVRVALFAAAFGAVAAATMLLTVDDLGVFWDRTLGFQADRDSPFSIWGLYDLDVLQKIAQAAAVLLAIALAVVPRRDDLAGLAALCAAVLIALQFGVAHWFYLYIVWFFPLVMLALLAPRPRAPEAVRVVPAPAAERPAEPAPA